MKLRHVKGEFFRAGMVLVTLLTVTLAPTPALAQSTGTILGVVKDASGAVVPDATVTITSVETDQTRTVTTGQDGAYRVPALKVGHYTVKIEKSGFKSQTQQGLDLAVAQEMVVNATLEVGAATQEVQVTSEIPLVNTTSSTLGSLVNEEKMSDLPLNGRNYIDLSLLQPGVSAHMNHGTGAGMTGTWFSSNGAPQYSNNVTIDGASMVNMMGGATSSEAGTTLGVDGIQEYKVITNAFSAEYGVTMGSQMLIVSKAGTNQWHGDVFEYLRNDHLDARNYFDTAQSAGTTASGAQRRLPLFQRNNFGGSFGGPIKKDKTFFYAVYEGLRQNLGFTAFDNTLPASCHAASRIVDSTCDSALKPGQTEAIAPSIYNFVDLYPTPNVAGNHFSFPSSSTVGVNFGQIRIDQNFSASDSLFGRYTIDNGDMNNANLTTVQAPTGIAFPGFRLAAPSRNQFLTLSETHIFSSTLLSTARLSFSRTFWNVENIEPSNLTGPGYSFVPGLPMGTLSITGISGIGPGITYGAPGHTFAHTQNIYTFSDDVYYTRGKHALKFGTLINRYNQAPNSHLFEQGQVGFTSLHTFLLGIYNNFQAEDPTSNVNRDFIYNTLGFYLQDDWRTTSRLTLNLGLRYEVSTTPWELNGRGTAIRNIATDATSTPGPVIQTPSRTNFSPRVGFAYDLTGKGTTSLRGAGGIYYDVGNIGAALLQQVYTAPPISTASFQANPTNQVLPLLTNGLVFAPGTGSHSLHTTDYAAGQPYLIQYNLTLDRQLPAGMGLTVSYVGTRGVHLWTAMEGNPTLPTALVNGVQYWSSNVPVCGNAKAPFCRENPNWAQAILHTTKGDSNYQGLQLGLNKRLSKGLQFQTSYTYSHSIDDTEGQMYSSDCSGNGMASESDPLFPRIDRGPSCFDLRHNIRANLLYHLPNFEGNGVLSKVTNGWWVGNIISWQTGYAFSVTTGANRSNSAVLGTQADRVNYNTAASTQVFNGISYNFVPYDPGSVITGNPAHWFNPLMFSLAPMVSCPNNAALTCGVLGDTGRGMLRGPGLATWDFSLVKDTSVKWLGEAGSVQFRAEFFNFLNHANFGTPNGIAFQGANSGPTGVPGAYQAPVNASAADPLGTAGQIVTTSTNSRQVQLALKIIF